MNNSSRQIEQINRRQCADIFDLYLRLRNEEIAAEFSIEEIDNGAYPTLYHIARCKVPMEYGEEAHYQSPAAEWARITSSINFGLEACEPGVEKKCVDEGAEFTIITNADWVMEARTD